MTQPDGPARRYVVTGGRGAAGARRDPPGLGLITLVVTGTSSEARFRFLGNGVPADSRRPADCSPCGDRLEEDGVPFVVAVSVLPGAPAHPPAALRAALGPPEHVPVVACDARRRASGRHVPLTLPRPHHEIHAPHDRATPVPVPDPSEAP